jgi:hypothetical protein
MTSLQPDQWHDLFVALAGAAAALTGLTFVAVSINLARILEYPNLPARAVETLTLLVGLLLLSVVMLIPGQGQAALGAEILVLGLAMLALQLRLRLGLSRGAEDPLSWTLIPLIVVLAGTVPMMIAGISVLAGAGGGLYWLVAEIVLALVGAMSNAWVLLVEIVR